MDKLNQTARPEALDFLKAAPDLQRDGFSLDTGNVSNVWQTVNLGAWEQPEGLEDDADLAVLRSLHERTGKEWRAMAESLAAVATDDDPSLNAAGRLKIAAKIIEPKIAAFAKVAEAELARVDARIAEEEAAVAATLRPADPAVAALHSDIRAHWKAAYGARRNNGDVPPQGLSLAILQDTIDDDTLVAIATAPAYMTGMTADLHGKARALLARRRAPERVTRIEALRTGKHRALQAMSALDRTANRLIDFRKARDLIEREASRGV